MTAGPGDEKAAAAAGRGHLRAAHADRERVIDTLKAAFVQGRLAKDEFDARVGQTLASRTYAELAALTADIPAGLAGARPPRKPAPAQTRPPVNTPVKAGVRAIIAAIMMLAAPFAIDGQHHPLAAAALDVGAVIIFVAAFVAWAWVLSTQPEKRTRGQLPGPPAPRAAGKASQRTASAAEAEQLPQINRAATTHIRSYAKPSSSPAIVQLAAASIAPFRALLRDQLRRPLTRCPLPGIRRL